MPFLIFASYFDVNFENMEVFENCLIPIPSISHSHQERSSRYIDEVHDDRSLMEAPTFTPFCMKAKTLGVVFSADITVQFGFFGPI